MVNFDDVKNVGKGTRNSLDLASKYDGIRPHVWNGVGCQSCSR